MSSQYPDSTERSSELFDPLFTVQQTSRLERRNLMDLASGLTGAVLVKGFANSRSCAALIDRLGDDVLVPYDPNRYVIPAARMGPVINEFNESGYLKPEYWPEAKAAEVFWSGQNEHFRAACIRKIGVAWGGRVEIASVRSKPLFYGIVRESGNGTLIHWDEVTREFHADLLDAPPIAQIAFNLFLRMPLEGGQTSIWRHRWDPRDEAHRVGFGYEASGTVADCQHIEVRANEGDAVLFDPRNFHAVRPGSQGQRLAIAFFIGVTSHGSLIIWS